MSKASRFPQLSLIALAAFYIGAGMPAIGAEASQKQALHRVDFKVEGASCVMCLRRIAQTFRKDKGVLKADVSVFRPYWSIVIYDANQTNMQKLTDSIKQEHVRLTALEDKSIAKMPEIIIPKGLGLSNADAEPKKKIAPVLLH